MVSVPRNIPWGFLLIKCAHGFGMNLSPRKENRGYSDHMESTDTKILYEWNSLFQDYVGDETFSHWYPKSGVVLDCTDS